MKKLNMQGVSHLLVPLLVVVAVAAIGTYLLVASHAATKCTSLTFREGSKGRCVKNIQLIINGLPNATYNGSVKPDGSYGSATKAKVAGLQKYVGLPTDGAVGPKTWTVLCHKNSTNSPLNAVRRQSGC